MEDKKNVSSEGEEQLTPNELLKKHIKDPEHTISDEDIRDLKMGEEAENEKEIQKETGRREDEISHESPEDDLPNPYNVLGS